MAEVTLERRGELLRGVFAILREHPDGLPARDVLRELELRVPPTPFEASTYPKRPSVRRYERIVRFATVTTGKSGWLIKDKGQWSLTDEGRKAHERYSDPTLFFREAKQLYRKWKADQPTSHDDSSDESSGEGSKIMLLDLKRLFDLWVEHYDKIAERYRRLLPLRPVYFLAPDDS